MLFLHLQTNPYCQIEVLKGSEGVSSRDDEQDELDDSDTSEYQERIEVFMTEPVPSVLDRGTSRPSRPNRIVFDRLGQPSVYRRTSYDWFDRH